MVYESNSGGGSRFRGAQAIGNSLSSGSFIGFFIFALIVFVPAFVWYGCRIEPGPDEIAVLIRKTGEDLPTGAIIATEQGQKGIQLDVLAEGRYFRNPYTWGWKIHNITDIPAGQLGVVARLFGEDLPYGSIIADKDSKGILPDVLRPGKYRLNPYAYRVDLFSAITIRPGHVGVVTSLIGLDVMNNDMAPDERNTFMVGEEMKGVLAGVLDPGTYYLNPYMVSVVEVNLQSQRFEMSGADVIAFLTQDGFTVTVEGTIEFALVRDHAALLTHRVGDMDDIMTKVILPRARGFSRIEGSKHPAIDYIVGETRQRFQNDLEMHLSQKCMPWGVEIRSVLIRKIIVPDEIASISRDREIAVQDARKFDQQLAQAKSKAELVRQEMLAEQNSQRVKAETGRILDVIKARKDQEVELVAASKDLAVAKVDFDAAAFQAEAILLKAAGDGDAIKAQNLAEASVLADKVSAFGGGMEFARYTFYQNVGPRINSILSTDGPEGMGALFGPYLRGRKEVSK